MKLKIKSAKFLPKADPLGAERVKIIRREATL
jgi:hypothetical protein